MWEYDKAVISIKDVEEVSIISEMDEFGKSGWEIFTVSEKEIKYESYGCPGIITEYTLYMKRKINQ